MLMVIFGAGASYDSVWKPYWSAEMGASNIQPPLAKELLDPRPGFVKYLRQYHQCGGLVAYLRSRLRWEGLEDALQREYQSAPTSGPHDQRALWAFRFYLHEIIADCSRWGVMAGGATNYDALIRRIERYRTSGPVLLVTFNYDALLEQALIRVLQQDFSATGNYIASTYKVFKLHGSVGWWRQITQDPDSGNVIDLAPVRWDQEGGFVDRNNGAIPAIAAPMRDKNRFQCPKSHVEELRRLLPNVDRVLVVGWRGLEENFLKLLRESLPKDVRGLVVSSDQNGANETVVHLSELPGTWEPSAITGFSVLIAEDEVLQTLLES